MDMRPDIFRLLTLLGVAIATLSLTACGSRSGREIDSRLADAEMLMEEHPDSALALLDNIRCPLPGSADSLTVGSGKQEALYALLLTQARHKNYIDETGDSLIATAVTYFDRDNDEPRLMKSLFYHAIINSNANDFPLAMTSAMRALKLAENLDDTYWQARISELIGHIFSETYFHEEAAEYLKHAAKLYLKDNREKSYYFALCDLAVSYSNSHKYFNCLNLIDSIIGMTSDPYIMSYCARIALPILNPDDINRAKQFADTLIKYHDIEPLSSKDFLYISNLKYNLDELSASQTFFDKAKESAHNQSDSLALYTALVERYISDNNIPKAFESLKGLLTIQNSIASDIKRQSGVVAQRNYYSQQAIIAELSASRRQNIIILLSAVGVIAIILVYFIFRQKIHQRDIRINRYMADILYLTTQHNESNETIHKLRKLAQALFHNRLDHINMLVNEFYEADGTKETQLAIYQNVKREITKLTSPKNITEIEKVVNSCFDNVVLKMREQLPNFSEDDINFITLTLAGYSAKTISLFTGVKPNSTYTKKKRLIVKINDSNAPDKDLFASIISNPLAF